MNIPQYWKKDWFVGLVVTLVFFVFGVADKFRDLEWWAYDLGVRFTTDRATNDHVVVIAIDDAAIQELGSWPWPRDILARLNDIIAASGPAVVGYAMPFDTRQSSYGLAYIEELRTSIEAMPNVNPDIKRMVKRAEEGLDTDRTFAQSLQKSGPIVLGMPYDLAGKHYVPTDAKVSDELRRFAIDIVGGKPGESNWLERTFMSAPVPVAENAYPPIPELSRYVHAVGHLNTGLNSEEQARREPLVIRYRDEYFPSLSLMIVAHYLQLPPRHLQADLNGSILLKQTLNSTDKQLIINTDKQLRVYPYFYPGKNGQSPFKVYSVKDVLNYGVNPKLLRDKAVIVGFTARQHTVALESPIGVNMPPVIFTAHVVSSLLNGDLYNVPAWGNAVQWLILWLIGIYLMFVLPRLRITTGVAVSVVLFLLLLNAHFVLMIGKSTWIPLVIPMLSLLIGHGVLSLEHFLAAQVERIQGELSTANLLLGQQFQTQGQLDQAFDRYRKCVMNVALMDNVYNLALDYERKRQYNKALSAFEFIADADPFYRDVAEKVDRAKQTNRSLGSSVSNNFGATLILNDTNLQKPVLGRYSIERELGRGAMGMVYLGRDPKIGRTVAIKTMLLSQEFEGDKLEEVKTRFFREAETAGRLNHPNIVTIYDVGEEEDLYYIAMDYLKGENLLAYCKSDSLLPAKEIFEMLAKVGDALEYAHRNNVVHRDIKPANIIYDRDTRTLKVTDFGVAFVTDSSKTKTGTILGSPSYMSPEQLAGLKVDGRTDLFSLGVTLYQMLTGELPFIGESLASLMYKITNEKHPDVRLFRPDLPACASRIINKALAKMAAERFQSGERFAQALLRCSERM
ncbi:MAG: CHASE2 domain-containing protein [Gammaproteobacteria bacterium]|nr:CHASE2 domain-containing protein [Gammaproteobacteria bacterium]